MNKTPKLFVFDCGDVVFHEEKVWHFLFSALGRPGISNIRELGKNATHAVEGMLDGSIREPEFWNLVEIDFGKPIKWEGLLKTYYHSSPNKDVVSILEALKAKGRRVVAGTNVILPFYEINQEKGNYSVFPKMYVSCFMHCSKPDPRFYLEIAKGEGVVPGEVFFTDDMPRNVDAARNVGFQSFLFKDADKLANDLQGLL
jgi:FMN phosphatase YigB (HAD superfamily)